MSITAQLFIVWLNPQAGKIKGILCSDWPPEIGPIACSVFLVLAQQEKVPSLLFYLISLFFSVDLELPWCGVLIYSWLPEQAQWASNSLCQALR